MLCVYHAADHDGKGSAAIVRSIYPQIELLALNHDTEIPFEMIAAHDLVVVCDFALPMDFMFELNNKLDFTWIDHHVSSIKKYDDMLVAGAKAIKGSRKIGQAAIELTWQYFYPDIKVPLGVELLAKQDLFDLSDKRVLPFEYAMQSFGQNNPQDAVWKDIFADKMDVEMMVAQGERILSWISERNINLVRNLAFEAEIDGLKCICANMPQGRSYFFDSLENVEKYDVLINFYMNKKLQWNISFYSSKKEVDVSKLAAKFGGGGHKGAAGASKLSQLPDFLLEIKSNNS